MITVWFFLVWVQLNGGLVQAGPFVSLEQCQQAREVADLRSSRCYQGVWSAR